MSPAYQPFILSCSHRDVRRVEDLLVILDIFTVVDYSKGYEKRTETSIRPVCMPYLARALSVYRQNPPPINIVYRAYE